MSTTYIAPVAHVIPLTTIRRERRLPTPGSVLVRVNERVQALDVVAACDASPKRVFLDVARGLGVEENEAAAYLRRQPGEHVEAGDVVAGPIGLTRRTVRAPGDGMVVAISGARVLLEMSGEPFELRAGFPGVVMATDGTSSVTIEAIGALVQGVWGNHRQDYGVMRLVGEGPEDRLQADQLDANLRGAILIGGECDHPAPLHQATELSVRGVVLGSLSADLIPLTRRLPYPIMVTEGFGNFPMNTAAYNLLSTNAGREAAVEGKPADPYTGERPEIIIPLPASHHVGVPEDVVPLAPGVRVRIVRAPHQGAVGVVRELPIGAIKYPSGILAGSARIDVEELGVITVPVTNLEVLQ